MNDSHKTCTRLLVAILLLIATIGAFLAVHSVSAQAGCPTPSVPGEVRNATCAIIAMPAPATLQPALPGTLGALPHWGHVGRVHVYSTTAQIGYESGSDAVDNLLASWPTTPSFYDDTHGFRYSPNDPMGADGFYEVPPTMCYTWDVTIAAIDDQYQWEQHHLIIREDSQQPGLLYVQALMSLTVTTVNGRMGAHDGVAMVLPAQRLSDLLALTTAIEPDKLPEPLYTAGMNCGASKLGL